MFFFHFRSQYSESQNISLKEKKYQKDVNLNSFQLRHLNRFRLGFFLSNMDWVGGVSQPPAYNFTLRVEIGECETCP